LECAQFCLKNICRKQEGQGRTLAPGPTCEGAIYDTLRKDNEKRSAEWARVKAHFASSLSSEQANRIYALILVTMHDAIAVGRDAAVLVDVDLSILGAETARFDEYEGQIREEYSWVPGPLYRQSRRQILRGFLDPREDLQH
jgi:predicted metal-dependent HD superfamily phosphohydrolase